MIGSGIRCEHSEVELTIFPFQSQDERDDNIHERDEHFS